MKNKIFLTLIILGLTLLAGCFLVPWEDLRSREFISSQDFDFYPKKDIYSIGDTLWISLSFPYNLTNESFNVSLNLDSFKTLLNIYCVNINSFEDTTSNSSVVLNLDYLIINKIGSSIDQKPIFFFVWDDERQKYVNEFGFILNEKGKFFIAQNNYKYNDFGFTIENVPELGYQSKKEGPIQFYSTFQSTGKGWFQFEVVE